MNKLTENLISIRENEIKLHKIQLEGQYFESIGDIEKCIEIYEYVINNGSISFTSFDRLIVLYNKNKLYHESIRVCDTYILNYINYYQQITKKSEKTILNDINIKQIKIRKENIKSKIKDPTI